MRISNALLVLVFSLTFQFKSFAQNQAYVCCYDNSLYLIDISTCSSQLIGYTFPLFYDIAYNPANGILYGISDTGGLYTISTSDASVEYIGNCGLGSALGFSSDGNLFKIENSYLFKLDVNTGKATFLFDTDYVTLGDLVFYNGKIFYTGYGNSVGNYLIQTNILNHSSAAVAPCGAMDYGLAVLGCEADLYSFGNWNVYKYAAPDFNQISLQCFGIVPTSVYGAASISNPVFDIWKDKTIVCHEVNTTLEIPIPNASYIWQDGSTNSFFSVVNEGTYSAEVTVNNCTYYDTTTVYIHECDPLVGMPNVLTANNDGVNDVFFPVDVVAVSRFKFSIYNRWGEKVFESSDILQGWDGTNCSEGTYYWIVEYVDLYENKFTTSGFLQLVR